VHTINAAKESRVLDDFIVSTDDPTIAEVSQSHGAKVPFLRPPELATDQISVWPAVVHGLEEWERRNQASVTAAVLLQPTSPLRIGSDIDACVVHFQDTCADVCATAVVAEHSPYFDMVEANPKASSFVSPMSPVMKQSSRRQDKPVVYWVNGAVFVVQREVLPGLENHFTRDRFAITEMPMTRSIEIDTEEDLLLAGCLLRVRAGR